MKRFEVSFSGHCVLTQKDIWPDGGPTSPTAAEVVYRMKEQTGSKVDLIDDWNLGDALTITVTEVSGESEEW